MADKGRYRRLDDRVVAWTEKWFGTGLVARLAAPALGGATALVVLLLALLLSGNGDRWVVLIGPGVGLVLTLFLVATVGVNERRRKR